VQVLSPEITEGVDIDSMGYKEDLQRVHNKIDNLKESLSKIPVPAPVGKWQKASPIIGFCAFLLALLVAYSTHTSGDTKNQIEIEVSRQLKEPLKQIEEVAGDVKEIKGILATLGIHTFASLPDSQLQAGLVQLKNAVAVAEQQKVKLSPALLKDVQQKLLRIDENSPDYWPTVLRFIQFASAGLSPDVPPPGRQPDLTIANNHGFGLVLPLTSHQVVLLDGGDLGADVGITRFDHSRIIFTQNPVHMRNVQFTDCVFEMPISATPNRYLRDAGRLLLASDLNSAKIPSL
jgi:hypothetical protein